jgi:hypothetical protein
MEFRFTLTHSERRSSLAINDWESMLFRLASDGVRLRVTAVAVRHQRQIIAHHIHK